MTEREERMWRLAFANAGMCFPTFLSGVRGMLGGVGQWGMFCGGEGRSLGWRHLREVQA